MILPNAEEIIKHFLYDFYMTQTYDFVIFPGFDLTKT